MFMPELLLKELWFVLQYSNIHYTEPHRTLLIYKCQHRVSWANFDSMW